jgi:hypothetical protein
MTSREPSSRPSAGDVVAAVDAPRAVDAPTLEIETDPRTAIMPAASAPERRSPSRRGLAAAVAVVVLLLLAFAAALQDDPNTTVLESTTTVTTPTTSPASVDPTDSTAVDCAALELESQALADRRREINEEYRDDRETRDRLKDEVQALQREVDALLREHCR